MCKNGNRKKREKWKTEKKEKNGKTEKNDKIEKQKKNGVGELDKSFFHLKLIFCF